MLTLGSGSLDNVESLNDEEIALYGRDLIDVSDQEKAPTDKPRLDND
jgi:hypothetical protein